MFNSKSKPLNTRGADTLSEIINLSVSSYGESEKELIVRKKKLLELGLSEDLIQETLQFESWLSSTDIIIFSRKISSIVRSGHELFGYEVSTIESSSNYLLTCEDLIKSSGCIGCCAGDVPTIDELSFMLTNKKTGSSLIHIHTAENLQSNKHELAENFRMCIKIVINAETKGVVRLDFPPYEGGTHGDYSQDLIPVAVISQDEQLVFIFRPSASDRNGNVTEIITADGTGFVVAKVGPADCLLSDTDHKKSKRLSFSRSSKFRKELFCIMFLDRLLGRSWKQLLFSVSTVFFYLWLVHKSYRKKATRRRHDSEDDIGKCTNVSDCPGS